jgi:hypothetical protein
MAGSLKYTGDINIEVCSSRAMSAEAEMSVAAAAEAGPIAAAAVKGDAATAAEHETKSLADNDTAEEIGGCVHIRPTYEPYIRYRKNPVVSCGRGTDE